MEMIPIPGAEIYYYKNFLRCSTCCGRSPPGNDAQLHSTMPCLATKPTTAIRGPSTYIRGASTSHSPGFPELLHLKTRVEEATPEIAYSNSGLPRLGYNAVLCNLYRNGSNSVGLHADAEPEIGPVIASVSLGAERLFRLKGHNGAVALAERLPHGSLSIMAGKTQKDFKHEVPKEKPNVAQPRINLTFRHIEHK